MTRQGVDSWESTPCGDVFVGRGGLLADAEFLLRDDGAVAGDVLLDKVVKETTTLAYEGLQSAGCSIIFVI